MLIAVDLDAVSAATELLPYFMITASRGGVGMGIMLGADVMLDLVVTLDCARTRGVAARAMARARVVRVEDWRSLFLLSTTRIVFRQIFEKDLQMSCRRPVELLFGWLRRMHRGYGE